MSRPCKVPVVRNLAQLEARVEEIRSSYGLAPSTLEVYAHYWSAFESWCREAKRTPLPASEETVSAFLAWWAASGRSRSVGGLSAAIAHQHAQSGHPNPTRGLAALTRQGISRSPGAQPRPAPALTAELTEQAAAAAPIPSLVCLQQRAAFLLAHGLQAPFSHVCALSLDDVADSGGTSIAVALPELRRWGVRPAFPARRANLAATGDELCPVAALRRLAPLVPPGARLLPEAGMANARLKEVAAMAEADAHGAYPGAQCDREDLWRLVTFMSREEVAFLRDRAYLLLTHAGAFRASEPFTLRRCDVTEFPDGIVARLRYSKADQFGRGQYVAIPYAADPTRCPVVALQTLIRLFRPGPADPLFRARSGPNIGQAPGYQTGRLAIIKLTKRGGVDGHFTGHSPRRGFCTTAAEAGETLLRIAITARHKRLDTTRRYVDAKAPEARTAPRALGL